MTKNFVSFLLATVFLTFLTAPTIIAIVDDSIDVSIFYASSEEEEKSNEKNKDIEVLFSEHDLDEVNMASTESENNIKYYFKKYPKPHQNLISPPPEVFLL